MNSSRLHTDGHHSNATTRVVAKLDSPTPTESLIGYDAEGIPPIDGPAYGIHITLPGKSLPPKPIIEPGFTGGVRESVSQAEILRDSGYKSPELLPVNPRDLAELDKMLAQCRHICRTAGCNAAVNYCGQNCEDCQGYIDSQRKLSEDITASGRKAWRAAVWGVMPWILVPLALAAAAKFAVELAK